MYYIPFFIWFDEVVNPSFRAMYSYAINLSPIIQIIRMRLRAWNILDDTTKNASLNTIVSPHHLPSLITLYGSLLQQCISTIPLSPSTTFLYGPQILKVHGHATFRVK